MYRSILCSLIVMLICLSFMVPALYWVGLVLASTSLCISQKRLLNFRILLFIIFIISPIIIVSLTQQFIPVGSSYLLPHKIGFIMSLMTGLFIAQNSSVAVKTAHWPMIVITLAYLTAFTIGIDKASLHPNNSENFIFVPVIISFAYYISFGPKPRFIVRLAMAISIMSLSAISTSRSAMALSLVVSIFILLKDDINYRRLAVLMLIAVLPFYYLLFDLLSTVFLAFEFANDFANRGVTSFSRLIMWEAYFNATSTQFKLFNGIDIQTIDALERYGYNPHNSFLKMHSSVGLLVLVLFIGVFTISLIRMYPNNLHAKVIFCVIIARASVDISIIYGRADFLLFLVIFMYLGNNYTKTNVRRPLIK